MTTTTITATNDITVAFAFQLLGEEGCVDFDFETTMSATAYKRSIASMYKSNELLHTIKSYTVWLTQEEANACFQVVVFDPYSNKRIAAIIPADNVWT